MTAPQHALVLLLTTLFAVASPAVPGPGRAAVALPSFERQRSAGCSCVGRAAAIDLRSRSASADGACEVQPRLQKALRGGCDEETPEQDDELEAGAEDSVESVYGGGADILAIHGEWPRVNGIDA